MQVLSYGYLKPESGDKGSSLFTALENNIQRVNDHNHNGTNSPFLDATALVGIVNTISSGAWATYGGPVGFYRQAVTLPIGFSYDTVFMSFRTSAGDYVFPKVERIDATQYYVYTTDNTTGYSVVYGG